MNSESATGPGGGKGLLGSLREALAAAGREDVATENTRQMEARAQSKAATRATPDGETQKLTAAKEPLALAAPGAAKSVDTGNPRDGAVTGDATEQLSNPVPEAGQASDAGQAPEAGQTSEAGQTKAIALPDKAAEALNETATQTEASAHAGDNTSAADAAVPATTDSVQSADDGGGKEADMETTTRQSAADAARQARGEIITQTEEQHIEMEEPTTKLARAGARRDEKAKSSGVADQAPPRTQLVRGKAKVGREGFDNDPVVGWLVIVGGPGLGAFRPIFEGNNTVGRSPSQRVAIDFGDEAISSEEQAYIRYDSVDRSFLFVPNLAKTNVVQVNSQKPTAAVPLTGMDVITMGRTQLVFVPFCSSDFDWSELSDLKE